MERHTGDLNLVSKTSRPGCARCARMQDRLEKMIAETRIVIELVQKSSAKRAKPVQMFVEINKEIAESMKALGDSLDHTDQEVEKDTHRNLEKKIQEKTKEIEKVVGNAFDAKPLLLMGKAQEIKGIGTEDILYNDEYDDPPDLTECLKCGDSGYKVNIHGVPMPCEYCNPDGKPVTIPGEHVRCPWCHAKKPMAYSCTRCDGAGHVPWSVVYTENGKCKFCLGKGTVYEDDDSTSELMCDACSGKGSLLPPKKSKADVPTDFLGNQNIATKTICSDCIGGGRIIGDEGSICLKCAGKGWTT